MTYLMANMVYNDRTLLSFLLEDKKVIAHSPILQEILAEKGREEKHAAIICFLKARFKKLPEIVESHVKAITDPGKLEILIKKAGTCKSLKGFQRVLTSV